MDLPHSLFLDGVFVVFGGLALTLFAAQMYVLIPSRAASARSATATSSKPTSSSTSAASPAR